jgi:hypothetical protein
MPKSAPPKLADLQREMLNAVRRPLLPGEQMQAASASIAEQMIKPNDRLTSFERLEVYNQQYWWRLYAAFADDFPGVRAVIGPRAFDRLTVAYLEKCPSRSWSLRNLGSKLADFLEEHPELSAPATALAVDVASVEWAANVAFDDPEREVIDPQKLASADPSTLRLHVQPYLQLLELRYPVDRLLARLKQRDTDTASASNAVSSHRQRRAVRLKSRSLRDPLFLAVHRVSFSVYYKRLTPLAYELLRALRDGQTLEAACETAIIASGEITPDEAAGQIREWFSTFTSLGWLCPRKR